MVLSRFAEIDLRRVCSLWGRSNGPFRCTNVRPRTENHSSAFGGLKFIRYLSSDALSKDRSCEMKEEDLAAAMQCICIDTPKSSAIQWASFAYDCAVSSD